MIENDRQLGWPFREYRDTKANIEGLALGAADEGCVAYATDADEFGTYDGAAWVWITDHNQLNNLQGGQAGEYYHFTQAQHTSFTTVAGAGYALVSTGANVWAADQTPAWTDTHKFAAGITFNGASGANEITVPDNTAIALELLDVGGLEYLRINSADANPYFLIDPAVAGIKTGVRTATPVDALEVYGAIHTTSHALAYRANGDMYLDYDSANGVGRLTAIGPDGTTRAGMQFTIYEGDGGGLLRPIEIQNDGDVALVQASGSVVIGGTVPGRLLDLQENQATAVPVLRLSNVVGTGVGAALEWYCGFGPKVTGIMWSDASGANGANFTLQLLNQADGVMTTRIEIDNAGAVKITSLAGAGARAVVAAADGTLSAP